MQDLTSATLPNRYSPRYYRMTARAVGAVFQLLVAHPRPADRIEDTGC
jgi:hypothetical protein